MIMADMHEHTVTWPRGGGRQTMVSVVRYAPGGKPQTRGVVGDAPGADGPVSMVTVTFPCTEDHTGGWGR